MELSKLVGSRGLAGWIPDSVTPDSLAKRREKGTGEKRPRNRAHLGSYVDWACLCWLRRLSGRVGRVVLCLSPRQRRLAFRTESGRGTAEKTRRAAKRRVARASSETSRTWATRCKFANHAVITVFGATRLARRDVPRVDLRVEGEPSRERKGDINDTAARCRHKEPNGKRNEASARWNAKAEAANIRIDFRVACRWELSVNTRVRNTSGDSVAICKRAIRDCGCDGLRAIARSISLSCPIKGELNRDGRAIAR